MMRSFAGAVLVLALSPPAAPAERFSDALWKTNSDIYQQILKHPFLTGLQDGTLDPKAFAFYMIQDAYYLGEFGRALEVTAAKAPKKEWTDLLRTHASQSVDEEKRLHESVFQEYGISREEVARTEPSPEAFAYTSFLLATAYRGSFAESMAALLPCYWIYWEVGQELAKRGSPNPTYQKWIRAYSDPGYGDSVRAVIAIVNELAAEARPEELARMKDNFRRSSRYEWMFWDSAYALRRWPPGTN
jgi:thiaminase/transcriptional activator TenA